MNPLDGKSATAATMLGIGHRVLDTASDRVGVIKMFQAPGGTVYVEPRPGVPDRVLLRPEAHADGAPWWAAFNDLAAPPNYDAVVDMVRALFDSRRG